MLPLKSYIFIPDCFGSYCFSCEADNRPCSVNRPSRFKVIEIQLPILIGYGVQCSHDCMACKVVLTFLSDFGLIEPVFFHYLYAIFLQHSDTLPQHTSYCRFIRACALLQLSRVYPNNWLLREGFSCLVQDYLRIFISFKLGQGQPKGKVFRNALHRLLEQN